MHKDTVAVYFPLICLRTQISLVRNLASEHFPLRLKEREAKRLGAHLAGVLVDRYGGTDVTRVKEITARAEKRYGLTEKSMRGPGYHLVMFEKVAKGRTIWCETMSANHLTFSITGAIEHLEEKAELLRSFVERLEETFTFAFHPKYGYLATQIPLIGTGLRIRSWMHLPGLVYRHHLTHLCNAGEAGNVYVELDEDGKPPAGNVMILFNRTAIKSSVQKTVAHFEHFLLDVVKREVEARVKLRNDEPHLMQDIVLRARGVTSRMLLSEGELIAALSDLRFAISAQVISDLPFNFFSPYVFELFSDEMFDKYWEEQYPGLLGSVQLLEGEREQHAYSALRAALAKVIIKVRFTRAFKERIQNV